ncbi:ribosome-associated translation inhibitor RaiA [bacterium]|nr:ribosome-associated translation inhibitor RaiA [bacterium]
MQLSITARHMELTQALKDYIRNKIERLNKYTDEIIDASTILSVEKYRHSAEITLKINGMTFNSVDITENMYNSIDRVVDKLERQLKKFKEKRKEHKHKKDIIAPSDVFSPDLSKTLAEDMRLVKSVKIQIRPMDLKDAIDALDLNDKKCFVFINVKTGKINVIYRDAEDKFILVEPEE